MANYSIVADPRVKKDLKEARDFLNSRRRGYGQKFIAEYRFNLKTLEENPEFQIRYNEIRCVPMKTFKYMIHFKVNENQKVIHIYAVLSTYLNPENNWI